MKYEYESFFDNDEDAYLEGKIVKNIKINNSKFKFINEVKLLNKFYIKHEYGYEKCYDINDIAKILRIDVNEFVKQIKNLNKEILFFENTILLNFNSKYIFASYMEKNFPECKFEYEYIYLDGFYYFYLNDDKINMDEIFIYFREDYKKLIHETFDKNGLEKPELVFLNDTYIFNKEKEIMLFCVLAEKELTNILNRYLIVKKLNGGKLE